MKHYFTLLLFVLAISTSEKANAQGPSLGFDTLQGLPDFPDSLTLGDTATFNLQIKNYGNSPFSGPIYIISQIQDTTGNAISTDSSLVAQATIAQGTLFTVTYTEEYSAARNFFVGIDVVVIWPKAVGVPSHDTLTYSVQIYSPSSVSKLLVENGIQIFPNPFSNQFSIVNSSAQNKIERVSILDMKGKLLLTKKPDEILDLSAIPDAVYIVEIRFKTGMRKIVKVQKQE